jgi:hypothetical protein
MLLAALEPVVLALAEVERAVRFDPPGWHSRSRSAMRRTARPRAWHPPWAADPTGPDEPPVAAECDRALVGVPVGIAKLGPAGKRLELDHLDQKRAASLPSPAGAAGPPRVLGLHR